MRHSRNRQPTPSFDLCIGQDLLRGLRLHIHHSMDKAIDHLVTVLAASGLNICKFCLSFLARVFFGLLESARVLFPWKPVSRLLRLLARIQRLNPHLSLKLLEFFLLLLTVFLNFLMCL